MKITVETLVKSGLDTVWDAWNSPGAIKQWNSASEDWHKGLALKPRRLSPRRAP